MPTNNNRTTGKQELDRTTCTSTRRGALKTLTTTAIGIAGVSTTSFVANAADHTTTITKAIVPESDAPNTEYATLEQDVPTDWHEALQHATAVHDREEFYEQSGVVGTMVRPGTFGGEDPSIQVEVAKSGSDQPTTDSATPSLESSIPESVDGVQIKVVEVATDPDEGQTTEAIASDCGQFNFGASPPAGVQCSGAWKGTLATPLIGDGQMYFATAWHLFDSPVSNDAKLYQASSTAIGQVVDGNCTDDFVACTGINGHSPTREIHGTGYRSWGHYTKTGVQALGADNEPVTKQGIASCKTSGHIGGVGVNIDTVGNGCGNRREQIRWGTSSALNDYDSGSVAYHHHRDDKVLIIALNAGSTGPYDPRGNFAFGTGAYHIHNEHDYGW